MKKLLNLKIKKQHQYNIKAALGCTLMLLGIIGLVLIGMFNNPITWGALAGIICIGVIVIGFVMFAGSLYGLQ